MSKDNDFSIAGEYEGKTVYKDHLRYWTDVWEYPRVSRINSVLNRPFLNKWQANLGTELAEEWTNQTRDIGVECHAYIAKLIGGYSIPKPEWDGLAPEIRNGLVAWEQARQTLKFKPVESELLLVSHKYGYAGTTDCVAEIKNKCKECHGRGEQNYPVVDGGEQFMGKIDCSTCKGKGTVKDLELLDWKVSSNLWAETLFQLAAYYMAYTENGGKLARCRAIRLDRDKGYWTVKDQLILEAEAVPDTFKAFFGLFEVYKFLRREHGK